MQLRYVRAFLAAVLLGGLYAAPAPAGTRNFIAVLNGGQETPPTTSNAFGVAFLTFDDKTLALCYSITYTGITRTAETAAHVHGPAAPGASAAILVALSPSGSPKNLCVTLPKANKKDLKRGMTYLNVHTMDNPSGEIRGQIIPTK